MTRIRRFSRAWWATSLGVALALAACGGAAEGPQPGHGTVRAVDAAAGTVTLQHGDIPGLMKAMTMTFDVATPSLLEGLAPGQVVDFRVQEQEGRYVVTEIAPSQAREP
jgi:Cu/Ag efflux protein CusF